MSGIVVERSSIPKFDGHVILRARATDEDADPEQVLSVAGVLARVALDVSGALEATAQDHKCRGRLYRDDSDAEVVDATRFDGCRLWLNDPDDNVEARRNLILHVPPNRERAWIAYLERAINALFERDRRMLAEAD